MSYNQEVNEYLAKEYPAFVIKEGKKEYFDMRALMVAKGHIK